MQGQGHIFTLGVNNNGFAPFAEVKLCSGCIIIWSYVLSLLQLETSGMI